MNEVGDDLQKKDVVRGDRRGKLDSNYFRLRRESCNSSKLKGLPLRVDINSSAAHLCC